MLYDIEALLEKLDISEKEKKDLIKEVRDEFPQDDMLFELHLFRAINYLKKNDYKNLRDKDGDINRRMGYFKRR